MTKTRKNLLVAALFLAPNFLGFAVFTLGPVILSLAGSFTTWSLRPTTPLRFLGFDNYRALFSDPNFYFYLYNTLYLMLAIPITIAGSLALAIYLNGKLKFPSPRTGTRLAVTSVLSGLILAVALWLAGWRNLGVFAGAIGIVGLLGFTLGSVSYRTFLYLPSFTAGAGTILLWSQLYNPNFGVINEGIESVYHFFGLHWTAPGWLTSTRSLLGFLPFPERFNNGGFGLGAREAIMIMGIWAGIGGNNMLLYLAALSNIPPELNEAADIDGAGHWARFRFITWPQLAPTTFFISVVSIIGGLQGGFEQARLMTSGGPAGITTTLSYYIYTQGFQRLDLGYGSSVAWVLFAMIFVVTVFNWKFGNREVT